MYVWFDASKSILHFRDGSQWAMGCTSSANEPDNGTMYPTEIKDRNGNQVIVVYNTGKGAGWPNSSGRIASVQDVRGMGGITYTFTYAVADASGIQHIQSITNSIGTAENYTFSLLDTTLHDPFSLGESFQNVDTLTAVSNGIPLTNSFVYDASGALLAAELPYCAVMQWGYTAETYPMITRASRCR